MKMSHMNELGKWVIKMSHSAVETNLKDKVSAFALNNLLYGVKMTQYSDSSLWVT